MVSRVLKVEEVICLFGTPVPFKVWEVSISRFGIRMVFASCTIPCIFLRMRKEAVANFVFSCHIKYQKEREKIHV